MQELFNIFESMDYPYFRQGSLSDEDYPNNFFTFWNFDTPEERARDNQPKRYVENVMVYFYTNDATKIYSIMDQFITSAKEAGLITMGKAHDCPTDKKDYFGRLVRIKIIHEEE